MTNHMEFRLSSEAVSSLCSVMGQPISSVLSPGLWIHRTSCVGMRFLIPVNHRYLIVKSSWALTPVDELDYHVFDVCFSDTPLGLPHEPNAQSGFTILQPFSEIHIGSPKPSKRTTLRSFALFQSSTAGSRESVNYDAAIQFHRTDRMEVLLAAEPSIRGGVICSYDKRFIRGFTESLVLRLQFP